MKKVISTLLVCLMLCSFVACGANDTAVNKEDLAAYVLQNITFAEQMEQVDSDYILSEYGLDANSCVAICYNSSAAVADTLVVFEAKDAGYIPTIQSAIESKIDYLHEGYSDYGPDEVPKIDGAVVIANGNLVVFCICPDDTAASQLINDYLK